MESGKMAAVYTPHSAQAIPEHRLICKICEKQYTKYTCPRCNLRHCSLDCYKKHSLRCTESFMRDNVMDEMRDIQATKENQRSMLETLRRLHFDESGRSILDDENLACGNMEDDADDSNGCIFSDKTLQLFAEGSDISLDKLSAEERKAFLSAVAAGEISHLIRPWNPWWLNPLAKSTSITDQGTRLVESVHPTEDRFETDQLQSEESDAVLAEVPAPPSEPLMKVRQLISVNPSPLISIHLAEVIYSYCFTLRFCNGDWGSEPVEAALALLSVSQVLGQAASPESVAAAFGEAVKTVCSPTFKHAGGLKFAVALFDDSATLLRLGRPCVVCALVDSYRMLASSKMKFKAELGVRKQDPSKDDVKGGLRALDGRSVLNGKPSCSSSASQKLEKGSQGGTYADLKKMRDQRKDRKGNRSSLSKEEGKLGTGIITSPNSRKVGATENRHQRRKHNGELRNIEAAIRKVYFLMCWANEQPNEVFLSLVLSIDNEKGRLLETSASDNVLPVMAKEKSSVSRSGPVIEEIVEKGKFQSNPARVEMSSTLVEGTS